MKYGGRREYTEYLGDEMARILGRQILEWKPDALIPVPLAGGQNWYETADSGILRIPCEKSEDIAAEVC